jgi:hypothetical protein
MHEVFYFAASPELDVWLEQFNAYIRNFAAHVSNNKVAAKLKSNSQYRVKVAFNSLTSQTLYENIQLVLRNVERVHSPNLKEVLIFFLVVLVFEDRNLPQ